MLAQTAELGVLLKMQNMLSGPATAAEASLAKLNATTITSGRVTGTAEKALGLVGNAATGMGNALNHAKGFLSNLLTGPLGMIGLGGAAFGAAEFFKGAISNTQELGLTIERLTGLTGQSAQSMSALVAVFNKFGISSDKTAQIVGFEEKTVGKLAETMVGKGAAATTKLTALQHLYGVTLTDSKGAALDFSTILNNVSDYYNSNATAGQKAALAATLFGRGYAVMIPVLKLGAAGFADAQQAAIDLGLTLTDQNAVDLKNYRESLRNVGDAVGGLQLQLGLDLIPTLGDLANSVTAFVRQNGPAIRQFFKDFVAGARGVGAFIANEVIPALQHFGSAAQGAWNAIPPQLRTLLVEALIGNKVIKTVFGIDIIGTVEKAAVGAVGGVLSAAFGSLFGKTIATPVVNVDGAVVNVGGPGGAAGGAAGAAKGAAGAAGLAAIGLTATTVVGVIAPLAAAWVLANMVPPGAFDKNGAAAFQNGNAGSAGRAQGQTGRSAADVQAAYIAKYGTGTINAITSQTGRLSNLQQIQNAIAAGGAAHALQAAQTANEDSQHLRLATQSAAQGAALHAALLAKAFANLTGLTKQQLGIVAHNIQLTTVAAQSHFRLTYAELLHKSHVDHMDHVSTLAKFDHLTIKEEQTKLAIQAQKLAVSIRNQVNLNGRNIYTGVTQTYHVTGGGRVIGL